MREGFFNTLFNSQDSLIVSGGRFETHVRTVADVLARPGEFITINELKPEALSREVSDVSVFRNFLVELDSGTLDKQVEYVERLGLPYSAAVYSGGKSVHFILSLETPLANADEYYRFATFLLGSLAVRADQTNKNPNRFSRTPGFVRDNGREQELLELRGRIPNSIVLEWLKPYWRLLLIERRSREKASRMKQVKRMIHGPNVGTMELISPKTREFIECGAHEGDRHARLMSAVTDLYMNGMESIEIEALLQPACDLSGIGDRGDLEQILAWAERKLAR